MVAPSRLLFTISCFVIYTILLTDMLHNRNSYVLMFVHYECRLLLLRVPNEKGPLCRSFVDLIILMHLCENEHFNMRCTLAVPQ